MSLRRTEGKVLSHENSEHSEKLEITNHEKEGRTWEGEVYEVKGLSRCKKESK